MFNHMKVRALGKDKAIFVYPCNMLYYLCDSYINYHLDRMFKRKHFAITYPLGK